MAGDNFLTLGASFDQQNQTIDTARQTLAGPALPPDFTATLLGRQQTLAGYATYQFDTGDWTWLPGVRGEDYRREVVSSGIESDSADLDWFPSLHVRRALSPEINLDVSYSRRVQRPPFQLLDPALRFTDVNRASSGNPNLDPTLTDAYEANLNYQKNGRSIALTFYDRISDDIVSPFTQVLASGVILTTQVNAGTSEQRGLQALLRGPLGAHWRYSLSANVLNREFDFLSGGITSRRNEIEYDGLAQLDYRDVNQDRDGANQFQIELRFQGPRHTLQSDADEFIVANFTWRRRLTPKLFGVLLAQDIFATQDNVNEVFTDLYRERTEFSSTGARVRFALTYQFGAGPARPPPDQGPQAPPIPIQ